MKSIKILCVFITAFLCVTAVSCGDTQEESTENSGTSVSETESETETQTESDTQLEEIQEEETRAETSAIPEETKPEETSETESISESEPDTQADNTGNVSAYGTTADIKEYIKTTEIKPPLWKVTDPETQNELYVMGTIHVVPSGFDGLPDYVKDIYENSDGIAVEYDTSQLMSDIRALIAYQQMFIYEDGSTIQEHISDETYQKAKEYFDSIGAYSEELDYFSAGYWNNQLENLMILRLENLSTDGIDSQAIALAQKDGKEVVSIETLETQKNALDGMSDELVDYVMNEMLDDIDDIDNYAEELAELYDLWASGDVDPMLSEELDDMEELPEELKDDYENYMDVMLFNRNKGMAEKASEFLKDGKNYLFMVGSAHYAGENGVDDILSGMGYTVEKIQ
ncbi:MAG: TraB/GumN family protein [Ruminococcus sp.]|nr:TraB/GumN family protein [Ruminococcus sp.]